MNGPEEGCCCTIEEISDCSGLYEGFLARQAAQCPASRATRRREILRLCNKAQKRHKPEEIVAKPRQVDLLISQISISGGGGAVHRGDAIYPLPLACLTYH